MKPRDDVEALREQLRRHQLYLGIAFASIGLLTLFSVGLLVFYGARLSARSAEREERLERVAEETTATLESLSRAVALQQQELDAIRKSANDDLQAMREAHRKLQAMRGTGGELVALREANQALWTALADQRAELLDELRETEAETPDNPARPMARFRLGETSFVDAAGDSTEAAGFLAGDARVHRATSGPPRPGELVIELKPDGVGIGDDYELSVRIVNDSNGPLDAASLRLDWTLGERNTGGDVPLEVDRVEPRGAAVVYSVSGRWTSAHERAPANLTATLTLADGTRLANALSW